MRRRRRLDYGIPTEEELRKVMSYLGRSKSDAKVAASRENGRLGGRPALAKKKK